MKKVSPSDTGGRTEAEKKLRWQQRLTKVELALLMIDEAFMPALISGPNLYGLRQEWGRRIAKNKKRLYTILWKLEKQGMILRQGKSFQKSLLTEKGRQRLYQLAFDLNEPPRQQPWDGRWHIVIFDVPEDHRIGRDLLRKKLYQLGCVQLQQSVFIYPYDIKNQIEHLRLAYDLKTDLNYLVVDSIDQHEQLVDLFRARAILPD